MKPPTKTEIHILAAVTALLWLAACKGKPHAAAPAAPTVEVTTVTQADVPIYHEWIGVLDGLVNAHIRAQVPGYLRLQKYQQVDPMKKDDQLYKLNPGTFKPAQGQPKGKLPQADAK